MSIDVHRPDHVFTKLQSQPDTDPFRVPGLTCDWCLEPAESADVIPLRDLDGTHIENLKFHHECTGDALRSVRARLDVGRQLGKAPKELP